MSVLRSYALRAPDGSSITANLADCVNAGRMPGLRDSILAGTFHQAAVADGTIRVEKPFLYVDFKRAQLFLVRPARERYTARQASLALDAVARAVPASMRPRNATLRVVFGLDELREKLIIDDAKLDDRDVELLKVLVLHDHSFLTQQPRLRLHLESVTQDNLIFMAGHDHGRRSYEVRLARQAAAACIPHLAKWSKDAHGKGSLYALKADHWVSVKRFAPAYSATAELHRICQSLTQGVAPDPESDGFKKMLKRLPVGANLSNQAKIDLRVLEQWARSRHLGPLEDQLFEVRFGIKLEDEWGLNQRDDDIDGLWQLLKDLPDEHVEGNVKIREIVLDAGGGGMYSPGSREISIGEGELASPQGFAAVVRHEVGHAVNEKHSKLVNDWLAAKFGWKEFNTTEAGINGWVDSMGGWGTLTAGQRQDVRRFLREGAGPGSQWGPPPKPAAPAGHPWRAADFKPRLALEQSGANWYENNAGWLRSGNRAFFVNFWYASLMTVSTSTLDLINNGMPSNYAAMSQAEFFAEIYALFYDPADARRTALPAAVRTWMTDKFGAMATVPQPGRRGGRK